jgi:hypothetical protein
VVCQYKLSFIKPASVSVEYYKGGVDAFEFTFDPDIYINQRPNPAPSIYYRLLTTFLPPHASRGTCKTIYSTGGGNGPAYACIYHWKGHGILVAHYLTVTGTLDIGSVDLDQDFSYIST